MSIPSRLVPARLTLAAGLAAAALAPLIALAAAPARADTTAPAGATVPATAGHTAAAARLLGSNCVGVSQAVQAAVPWAQQKLRPVSVWGLTMGAGQTVAVLDSGVSATAPALAGAVLPGQNESTGKAANTDCAGHGTFVAGLIAARPTAGSGFNGIAPAARILPVNVINDNGDATTVAVAAGIRYAVARGATVIDVSPAVTPHASPELQAAVAYAQASNVLVVAAINAGGTNGANQVSYPAAYPGVIAVTSVDAAGSPQSPPAAGVQPVLAGPGYQVTSIGPLGPGEVTASGPALATGFVAGTAALVRSYYPGLTAAQVARRLEATADPPGDTVPDPEVGYGVVDPYSAVTTVLGTHAAAVPAVKPPRLPPPVRPDTWPAIATVLICVFVALGLIGGAAAGPIIRHGRYRGWRPPPSDPRYHSPPSSAAAGARAGMPSGAAQPGAASLGAGRATPSRSSTASPAQARTGRGSARAGGDGAGGPVRTTR
jgi:membrane-anchored mycosin MYCP